MAYKIEELKMKIGKSVYEKSSKNSSRKLTGLLHGVVVVCPGTVNINITSKLGYTIFNGKVNGTSYLPIRITAVNTNGGEQSSFGAKEMFYLDEEVIVQVDGIAEQKINIIFRLE